MMRSNSSLLGMSSHLLLVVPRPVQLCLSSMVRLGGDLAIEVTSPGSCLGLLRLMRAKLLLLG
jgi:hypothetical protein